MVYVKSVHMPLADARHMTKPGPETGMYILSTQLLVTRQWKGFCNPLTEKGTRM